MRRTDAIIVSCSLLLALAVSCAAPSRGFMPGGTAATQRQKTYEYPFGRVWQGLVFVVTDRQMPIQAIEKESGVLTTDFVRFDRYGDLGRCALMGGTLEVIDEGRYSVSALVTAVSDSTTTVRFSVHTEKLSKPFLGIYDWRAQESTGCIESLLFLSLNKQLAEQ